VFQQWWCYGPGWISQMWKRSVCMTASTWLRFFGSGTHGVCHVVSQHVLSRCRTFCWNHNGGESWLYSILEDHKANIYEIASTAECDQPVSESTFIFRHMTHCHLWLYKKSPSLAKPDFSFSGLLRHYYLLPNNPPYSRAIHDTDCGHAQLISSTDL